MKPINPAIYNQLQKISDEVKQELARKGIAIPVKNEDGSISLGYYTIIKHDDFYSILDHANEIIVDKINLPQTAILLANNLALGKFLDNRILNVDRNYGYAEFEERLQSKKKTYPDLRYIMAQEKRIRKESYKRQILKSFEKLRKFV